MTDGNPNLIKLETKPEKPAKSAYPHHAEFDPALSYSDEENALIRGRQASRSLVMGFLLIGMCVLFFGITVAKIGYW
jgi:hypothetical protein